MPRGRGDWRRRRSPRFGVPDDIPQGPTKARRRRRRTDGKGLVEPRQAARHGQRRPVPTQGRRRGVVLVVRRDMRGVLLRPRGRGEQAHLRVSGGDEVRLRQRGRRRGEARVDGPGRGTGRRTGQAGQEGEEGRGRGGGRRGLPPRERGEDRKRRVDHEPGAAPRPDPAASVGTRTAGDPEVGPEGGERHRLQQEEVRGLGQVRGVPGRRRGRGGGRDEPRPGLGRHARRDVEGNPRR
mmetsp:Transcript_25932/g.58171  ORF Transcript_25932/g.58171 Transcript_25932/m.58171 type:complete len:238 (-) Transcript_25932:1588-2301(-)